MEAPMRLTLITAAVAVAALAWALYERDGRIAARLEVDRLAAQAAETERSLREWAAAAEAAAAEAAARAGEAEALRSRIRRAPPSEAAQIGSDALRGRP